ncbi:LysR substrate-binding domain-containing protein [Propionivibrio sp.]|uniref:LysR substrate-binding domain-containing protein n=1 Tax=Propionivibrio sp. TaxID=2212460 RepID=UPI003FA78C89
MSSPGAYNDLDAIADAAVAGMGLAWLPFWLIRDRVLSGTLVQVLKDQTGYVVDTYALWPKMPRIPLRVRVAVDALVERLPKIMT